MSDNALHVQGLVMRVKNLVMLWRVFFFVHYELDPLVRISWLLSELTLIIIGSDGWLHHMLQEKVEVVDDKHPQKLDLVVISQHDLAIFF